MILATKVVTCRNNCYEGDYIENPYYTRQYGGDTPDFGPQDHSKKNNPIDNGLAYENFCPDPEPPALDAPFPRLGQGADLDLELTLSSEPLDSSLSGLSGEDKDFTTDSSDLDTVGSNPNFIVDDTIDPSANLFDSNEIASADALDYDDISLIPGSMDETTFSDAGTVIDPGEDLFLSPGGEGGSSYTFASLDGRSSIRDDDKGGLGVDNPATSAVEGKRKQRRSHLTDN